MHTAGMHDCPSINLQKKERYTLVVVTVIVIIHAGYDLTHFTDVGDLGNI